jgi:hypothetical protein
MEMSSSFGPNSIYIMCVKIVSCARRCDSYNTGHNWPRLVEAGRWMVMSEPTYGSCSVDLLGIPRR